MVKACLILATAVAVAIRIAWHVVHPVVPVLDVMGLAAVANLIANGVCLYLLTPHWHGNVNMASAWEYSRNDVIEGVAVVVAAVGVGLFKSGWPDLVIGRFCWWFSCAPRYACTAPHTLPYAAVVRDVGQGRSSS